MARTFKNRLRRGCEVFNHGAKQAGSRFSRNGATPSSVVTRDRSERGSSAERNGVEPGSSVVTDRSEQGSAVAEFVLIATPLFLPALLFFNAMHGTATDEINVSHIARQAVRAFATAPDLNTGHQRVRFILDKFSQIENRGVSDAIRDTKDRSLGTTRYEFTYNISCGAQKCLTPGSLVELELYRKIVPVIGLPQSENRKSKAIAQTYVDKWRETE